MMSRILTLVNLLCIACAFDLESSGFGLFEKFTEEEQRQYPHAIQLNRTAASLTGNYLIDLQIGWPRRNQTENSRRDTFAVDTTTSYIIAATVECTECSYPGVQVYNKSASRTIENEGSATQITIPAGSFSGTPLQEQVCISTSRFRICDSQANMFAIESGSWPSPNIFGLGAISKTQAPIIVKNLTETGFIDNQIAVLNINPNNGNWNSILILGGVPDGLIQGEWYDHKYHPVSLDGYSQDLMMVRLSEIWYGKKNIVDYSNDKSNVLLASTELNAIKTGNLELFKAFMEEATAASSDLACSVADGTGSCTTQLSCSSLQESMKNLTIQIDSVYYILPPESLTETDFNCKLLVEYEQQLGELTMIGLPFFENFVVVYEYENGRVQLGLNLDARAGAAIDAVTPWDKTVDKLGHLTGWQIFGLVVAFVAILLLLAFCCRCLFKAIGENRDENDARRVLYESGTSND